MTDSLILKDVAFELVEFLIGLPMVAFISYSIVRFIKYYLKEGDIRIVFLSQAYIYNLIVVIESLLYMLFGCANDFCIISFKVFVFVNTFLYAQVRFTGRAAIKLTRMTRSFLFLFTLTFFWATAFFFASTANTTNVFLETLSPYEKLSQIVSFIHRPMNGDFTLYAFFICSIPPLFFNTIALIIDIIEQRPYRIRVNTFNMFIPTLINAYLVFPYLHFSKTLDIFLLMLMVFMVTWCTLREGYLIIKLNSVTASEVFASKVYNDIQKEKNKEVLEMKRAVMAKMFVGKDDIVSKFKNKKLQEYIKSLQLNQNGVEN